MRIEPMPVVGARHLVPGPVGPLRVDEDDARAGVFAVVVRPDIEVAIHRAGLRPPRALEPRMLVGGVVDHQFGDHPHPARMRRGDEAPGIGQRAVIGMHAAIVADVVAVVEPRRGIERQQPDRVHAQIGDVVELGDQAGKIADAVVVGIEERLDVQLIDDRVLVPQRVLAQRGLGRGGIGDGDVVHHGAPGGATCQIANGRSAGSRRMRWCLPVPDEAVAAHQVGRRQRRIIRQAPFPQRDLDCRFLHAMRDRG